MPDVVVLKPLWAVEGRDLLTWASKQAVYVLVAPHFHSPELKFRSDEKIREYISVGEFYISLQ